MEIVDTKNKIIPLVQRVHDKIKDDLNTDILQIKLNLLYSHKIYDQEAEEIHNMFDSIFKNVNYVISDHQKNMITSFEQLFEETGVQIKEIQTSIKTK